MSNTIEAFNSSGYVVIPNFVDIQSISTISKYLENSLNRGQLSGSDGMSSYCKYADPLIEVLLNNHTNTVGEIVGKDLSPTYSYARVYLKSDELNPHIDRPACEYSVTVNVASEGQPWPFFLEDLKGQKREVILNPSDAVIYKGCEVVHWREPMSLTSTTLNVQFMLHYIETQGKFANYKFDGRSALGLKTVRS